MSHVSILFAFFFMQTMAYATTPSFVLSSAPQQKKYSTNRLKELIGQETKEVFNQTTTMNVALADIHEHVATLQNAALTTKNPKTILKHTATMHNLCGKLTKELTFVQQRCSSLIESLFADTAPFKKASKDDLHEALSSLSSVKKNLTDSVSSCQRWNAGAKQTTVDLLFVEKKMGLLCKNLDSCVTNIMSARSTMDGKRCLKGA